MNRLPLRHVLQSKHLRGLYGLKPVYQTLPNAGGACCIATALRYFGQQITERNCVDAMGTNDAIGTDPIAMLKYLSKAGFNAYGYPKYPFELLLERAAKSRVSLIRWNDRPDHWNVIAGWDHILGQVVVLDPCLGYATFSTESLEERWNASPRLAIMIDRPKPGYGDRPARKTCFKLQAYRKKITVDGKTVAIPAS